MDYQNKKIIILGIGNTLYTDEGIGVHVLPELEEIYANHDDIEVYDGSTDGIKLLGPVEDTDHLIVVDAINSGAEPGTIIRVEGDDIPKYFGVKMSIHQLGFQEVLGAAKLRERYPNNIVLLGMQPASLAFGIGLSEIGLKATPELIHTITEQVKVWSEAIEKA